VYQDFKNTKQNDKHPLLFNKDMSTLCNVQASGTASGLRDRRKHQLHRRPRQRYNGRFLRSDFGADFDIPKERTASRQDDRSNAKGDADQQNKAILVR